MYCTIHVCTVLVHNLFPSAFAQFCIPSLLFPLILLSFSLESRFVYTFRLLIDNFNPHLFSNEVHAINISRYIRVPKWSMGRRGYCSRPLCVWRHQNDSFFFCEMCASSSTDSKLGKIHHCLDYWRSRCGGLASPIRICMYKES